MIAPDHYQELGLQEEAREVRPTDPVVLHRVRDGKLMPDQAFWTLVPPWTESVTNLRETRDGPRLVPPPQTHFNSRRDTLLKSPGWRRLLSTQRGVLLADDDLLASLPHHRMPAVLLGDRLGAWLDPRTPDSERCLQTTLGEEFEVHTLPAARYDELVPEARTRSRTSERRSASSNRQSEKPILPDLFS